MKEVILEKLKEIEIEHNVHILLAVESGSRAWGFASPDSDYDVRFIYVRPKEFYLRLDRTRDVIEEPISELLDINGWDIDKTLRLLHRSNPTLMEWFSSPIIYIDHGIRESFSPLMSKYFSSKKGLYHYLSMAKSNYREYLKSEMVRAKKYFYVLRPVLACKWILEKGTPPPMLFSELMEAQLDPALKPAIDRLLELKMSHPEMKLIPRMDAVNEYLDESIASVEQKLLNLVDERNPDWAELNDIFLDVIGE